MDEAKIAAFKGKVISGTIALTGRTLILQLISFTATFVLTLLLSPAVFGVFFVVTAVISFLTYFSDIGLAAALVQKKEEPEREDLVSVFTLQQLIVLSIAGTVFLFSRPLAGFYGLTSDGLFLLYALLFSFFLASLKTIPSILLERRLEFHKLVLPQILENIAFYAVAITLAFMHMDVASFAWAAIARGVVGLISVYIVSPWLPGIGLSLKSLKSLVSFGLPFQANSLLALVKDDLLTLYLGKVLPFASLGYLGWAKKYAEMPLRLIMDSVIRVSFPAFSRIQHEKAILTKGINKTVFFLSLLLLPVSVVLIIYIQPLIELIPKYVKWQPAITSFYLFAASGMLSAFSSPLVNALNALGKIKKSLILMVVWTALTWLLVPLLTRSIGMVGWPVSALIISLTLFMPVLMLKKYVSFSFLTNALRPLPAVFAMSVFSVSSLPFASGLPQLFVCITSSVLIYSILVYRLFRTDILPFLPAGNKKS